MKEGHGADGCADFTRAARGFVDLATVDFNLDGVVAGEATEEGNFHVRNNWGCTDDETFDAN